MAAIGVRGITEGKPSALLAQGHEAMPRGAGMHANASKPVIGFDLDDTMADLKSAALAIVRDRFGIDAGLHDMKSARIQDNLAVSREDVKKILVEVWGGKNLPALTDPQIPRIMQGLHQDFSIAITTATDATHDTIVRYMAMHQIPYDFITKVNASDEKVGIRGVDAFVDDYSDIAISVSGAGKFALLFERPWNQELRDTINSNGGHELIRPVSDFAHISATLYELFYSSNPAA